MQEPDDRELIGLVRGGDASALETLFARHYRAVYRIAWRWCGERQDAEDVAQEVFVKLVRTLGTFRGRSSFTTWLYRIVVNTALDHRRRGAAALAGREGYAEHRLRHNAAAEPAGDPVEAERIRAALARLPEKQRAAVHLVFGEGLSHREAAQVLGCPEVSVSWRIFQARKRLRTYLER